VKRLTLEPQWKERRARSRVPTFIAREGIHITLIAEAYKLHVHMFVGEVKDGAYANKVAIVH
jgi:hypothetical protein